MKWQGWYCIAVLVAGVLIMARISMGRTLPMMGMLIVVMLLGLRSGAVSPSRRPCQGSAMKAFDRCHPLRHGSGNIRDRAALTTPSHSSLESPKHRGCDSLHALVFFGSPSACMYL